MEYRIVGRPSYSLLELKLKPGEEVLAETGAMVYMKDVELKTEMKGGLLGGLKRSLLGGESFFVNRFVSRGEGILGLAQHIRATSFTFRLTVRFLLRAELFWLRVMVLRLIRSGEEVEHSSQGRGCFSSKLKVVVTSSFRRSEA